MTTPAKKPELANEEHPPFVSISIAAAGTSMSPYYYLAGLTAAGDVYLWGRGAWDRLGRSVAG